MRSVFLALLLFSIPALAQSGRARQTPTPVPKTITGPSVNTMPAPQSGVPGRTPSPLPAKKPELDEIIKVDSALVPIPVSVTDQRGRAVSTLSLMDFELRIDGKSVEISELARSETPVRLAMLFDNSSSVLIAREFEINAAIRFFRRVIRPERDSAALFSMADYTRLEQPFTSDVSQLVQAVEYFPEPKGATALLDGIIKAAEYLRSASGRRVMVIVSDGEDTYSDIQTTLADVVRILQLANCQVYVVQTKDFENFKRTGARTGSANTQALAAERRMTEITAQTGGAVHSPIDEQEMKDAFERISADLSQQYILSYYPDDDTSRRGEFRTITLSIKNKPNLTVRTRKGYYVPKK